MASGLHRALARRPWDAARPPGERWKVVALNALAVAIPVGFVALLVQGFTLAAFDLTRALLATLFVLVIAGTVRVLLLPANSDAARDGVALFSLRRARADLLHVILTVAAGAVLLWVWRDVVAALGYLQDIPLWTAETVEGLKTVTVANLLSCLAVLGGTLLTFWALPLIFATESSDSTQRIIGRRPAIVALVRYVVLIVGVAIAFSLLNIGWSKLQWMAAGLSVGLGFGLQETAANLFSGLTLLSERSVRVGDVVTVGDKTGVVTRIRVRATTLRDSDGREIVIPNRELVSTQVTNWTLVDTKRRLHVAVGVDYGSDTTLVQQKLIEAARERTWCARQSASGGSIRAVRRQRAAIPALRLDRRSERGHADQSRPARTDQSPAAGVGHRDRESTARPAARAASRSEVRQQDKPGVSPAPTGLSTPL